MIRTTTFDIPVITLPEAAERLAIDLGGRIPVGTPHLEASQLALAHSVDLTPAVADSLQPVHDNTSFVYIVGRPEVLNGLPRPYLENYMRVRTLAVATALGELSADPIEGQALAPLAEVTPKPGREDTQTLGGIVQLELHNENQPEDRPDAPQHLKDRSVHDTKTDIVVLGTVVNTTGTISVAAPQRRALDIIERDYPHWFAELQRPVFRLNPLYGEADKTKQRDPEPILREDGSVYFDFGDMTPITKDAEHAFSVLKRAIELVAVEFVPRSGEIQIVDNHESPHGRRAIDTTSGERLLYSAHVGRRFSPRRAA